MYLKHFSLREAPFSITPDTAFFYPHEGAQAALNTACSLHCEVKRGLSQGCGGGGCGKTVLCRQLLKTLQTECVTAYIPNPDMERTDLLLALTRELGVALPFTTARHQILDVLQTRLLKHAQSGRRVVVCIDEALVLFH